MHHQIAARNIAGKAISCAASPSSSPTRCLVEVRPHTPACPPLLQVQCARTRSRLLACSLQAVCQILVALHTGAAPHCHILRGDGGVSMCGPSGRNQAQEHRFIQLLGWVFAVNACTQKLIPRCNCHHCICKQALQLLPAEDHHVHNTRQQEADGT